jgi:hypothetical protein
MTAGAAAARIIRQDFGENRLNRTSVNVIYPSQQE